jgi:hypothetical protein
MRSTYSIKLELLLNLRIKIERVNLFELKFNSSITLLKAQVEVIVIFFKLLYIIFLFILILRIKLYKEINFNNNSLMQKNKNNLY